MSCHTQQLAIQRYNLYRHYSYGCSELQQQWPISDIYYTDQKSSESDQQPSDPILIKNGSYVLNNQAIQFQYQLMMTSFLLFQFFYTICVTWWKLLLLPFQRVLMGQCSSKQPTQGTEEMITILWPHFILTCSAAK